MRLLRPVFWGAAALLALGRPPAAAAADGFSFPAAGERIEAGAQHDVTWTLESPAALRPFDEMELMLSLDGGATYPLRVTGSIDPVDRHRAWRVPALPTEHARLILRAGDDEAPGSERVVLVSDEFVIASPPSLPLEELFDVRGEWRTREALEAAPLPDPRELGRDAKEEMSPLDRPEAAPPQNGACLALPLPARSRTFPMTRTGSFPVGLRADSSRRPASLPLRE